MSNNLNENIRNKFKNTNFRFNFSFKDLIWIVVIIFVAVMYFTKDDGGDRIDELENENIELQDSIVKSNNIIYDSEIREKEIMADLKESDETIEKLNQEKGLLEDEKEIIIKQNEENRNNVVNLNLINKVKFLSDRIK
jgi:hypothetical protein